MRDDRIGFRLQPRPAWGLVAFISSPVLLSGWFAAALGYSAARVLLVETSVVLVLMVASAVGEALKERGGEDA